MIIYVQKILEGLVPIRFPPICTKTSDRRGRTCIMSHINVGRLGTLEYNSFRWHAICLFNQLPLFVCNTTVCSNHRFKKQLDSYISTVPDSQCQPGFNNSLDHGDFLRWETSCKFVHPKICRASLVSGKCDRNRCYFYHVTGSSRSNHMYATSNPPK